MLYIKVKRVNTRNYQHQEKNVFSIFFLFFFLGPHLRHMEVSRLGVESELQLWAYTAATATPEPSCVCDLYHSSWQLAF